MLMGYNSIIIINKCKNIANKMIWYLKECILQQLKSLCNIKFEENKMFYGKKDISLDVKLTIRLIIKLLLIKKQIFCSLSTMILRVF